MVDAQASYRKACAADVAELAEMRWAMRLEGGEKALIERDQFLVECAAYYRRSISHDVQSHWVATIHDQIVGTVSLHRVQMIPRPCRLDDWFGCIINNYVLPEHRGRGLAAELLQYVIAAAAAEDLELLVVWPSEQAVPFYSRAGFHGENDVMELRLRD
jgi:GNAT superfamily N-acetyltransferase